MQEMSEEDSRRSQGGGCGELKFNGKRLMNDGHEKMSNLISNQKGLCEFPVLEGGRAAFDATCCRRRTSGSEGHKSGCIERMDGREGREIHLLFSGGSRTASTT